MAERWRVISLLVVGVSVVGGAWREHAKREQREQAREEARQSEVRRAEFAAAQAELRAWSEKNPVFQFAAPALVSPTQPEPAQVRLTGTLNNTSDDEIAGVAFTLEARSPERTRSLTERLYLPFPVPASAAAQEFQRTIGFRGVAALQVAAPAGGFQLSISEVVAVPRKLAQPWLELGGAPMLALFLDATPATEVR